LKTFGSSAIAGQATPEYAVIVVRELEPAAVRIPHQEGPRPWGRLDRLAHDGVQALRPLVHLVEPLPVDVERELVGILSRAAVGGEEDEDERADAKRVVSARERLAPDQLGVERLEGGDVRRPEGDVVQAEDAHSA
jgi:hypothetical protein